MKNILSYSRKNLTLTYRIIKFITITLTVFAIIFVNRILSDEFISAKKYMELGVVQTASNLSGRVTNSVNVMNLLALEMSNEVKTYSDKNISDFLFRHINDYDFYKIIFVTKEGKAYIAEKNSKTISKIDVKNEQNFDETMNASAPFIKTSSNPNTPSGYVNTIGVFVDGNKGMLISQIFGLKYLKILKYNSYDGKGYSCVISENGDYVIKPEDTLSSNFFKENIKYINSSKEEIMSDIKANKAGSFIFSKNNKKYIASYALINMTNNYVLTVVPKGVITFNINKMLTGIVVIVVIIALLLIFLLYFSTCLFEEHEELIFRTAFTDKLTQGGNENKFMLEAKTILSNTSSKYAVIAANIAGFRAINELYGRKRADEIIKDIYLIIENNLTLGSVCARIYASEFAILYKLDNIDNLKEQFMDKIANDVSLYNAQGIKEKLADDEIPRNIQIKLNYGIYIADSTDINQMYEKAYFAKAELKNSALENYKFYDETMRKALLNEKKTEAEMHNALKERQFKMFLQPKFDISTGKLSGAEALIRWIHPERGLIPPNLFIPIFEKNGFILEVDRFMWEEAAKFVKRMEQQGIKPFPVSVNVSRIHMNNDYFISELVDLVIHNDINPRLLELEVTESACFDDEKRFKYILNKLKEHNFHISMDDFGTGYSSLNMLRHLPVDIIKLDMGFIKDSIVDNNTGIILESIVQMAQRLGMKTVAEGIETEEQMNFLRSIHCDIGQGYLFGKPVDVETFIKTFVTEVKNV